MFLYVSEEERAEKVMESTKSAVMSAQKAIIDLRRSSLSKTKAQ